MSPKIFAAVLFLAAASRSAEAQQGYEYEVYGASQPKKGLSELELHLNFVPSSMIAAEEDQKPSDHALRTSLELSHGISSWLEASAYVTGYARSGSGASYVGNRLRVTALLPRKSSLPIHLGLSQEIGFARKGYSESVWTYEIAPIIGKSFGNFSMLVNPSLERGLGGTGDNEIELEPRARFAFQPGDGDESVALEYYGVLGPITGFDSRSHQRHQIFAFLNGDLPGHLEGSIGLGRGLTRNSDRWTITTRFEVELPHR